MSSQGRRKGSGGAGGAGAPPNILEVGAQSPQYFGQNDFIIVDTNTAIIEFTLPLTRNNPNHKQSSCTLPIIEST